MAEELWLGSIAEIRASVSDEPEVPLSLVHRDGLNQTSRATLDESQNLRLLRTSVYGLESGRLSLLDYERNVEEVLEVARRSWWALQKLEGEPQIQEAAAICFEQLYQACELMFELPHEGLRQAVVAFQSIDQLEQLVLGELEQQQVA